MNRPCLQDSTASSFLLNHNLLQALLLRFAPCARFRQIRYSQARIPEPVRDLNNPPTTVDVPVNNRLVHDADS